MRILICGGRDFGNTDKWHPSDPEYAIAYEQWQFGLDWLTAEFKGVDITVISGNAKGADEIGEDYGICEGHDIELYPADWKTHGKKAGILRNIQMLEEGKPDLVVAFPGGRGTAHMVKIAKAAGVEVIEVAYPVP